MLLDPSCILLPPSKKERPSAGLLTGICAALSTRSGCEMTVVRKHLRQAVIEEWGKVRRVDSDEGDTIRAAMMGIKQADSRDATYIRVG